MILRRRLRWIAASLLLLIGIGVALHASLATADRQLMHQATPFPAVHLNQDTRYQWYSDHNVLTARGFSPFYMGEIDVRTGRETRFLLSDQDYFWPDLAISPDGQWILGHNDSNANTQIVAATLDGLHRIYRKENPEDFQLSNLLWMPNSRQWVYLLMGERGLNAVIKSLDTPDVVHKVPIGFPKGTLHWDALTPSDLLGFTGTDRVLATVRPDPNRNIYFYEFDVGGGPAHMREYMISLPKVVSEYDGNVPLSFEEEVVLSPRGDRLAWLIHSVQEPSSIWKFLSRWIPALRPTPHPIVELRTSCLDGSDVHEIGHLDAPKTREDPRPEHLQWLPDGKQLSFIYKDRLYTVPAD